MVVGLIFMHTSVGTVKSATVGRHCCVAQRIREGNYTLKSGERETVECVADAIADNRSELVHLPSAIDLHIPLPFKGCLTCDGRRH